MTTVSSILVEIKAIGDNFVSAFQGYKKEIDDFNHSIENGNAALTKMAEAFTAFLGLEQLKTSVEYAQEANVSLAQLDQVLKTTGQGTAGVREEMLKLAETEEQLTGIHKDQVISIESILLSYGATSDQVLKLTPVVFDAATRLGRAPEQIAKSLGEATRGNTAALRSFGITVKGEGNEIQTFSGLLALLGTRFQGSAEAAFHAKGSLGQLQVLMHDLRENLGQLVLSLAGPFLQSLADGIKHAAEQVKNFPKLHPEIMETIRALGGEFGQLAIKIGVAIAGLLTLRAVMTGLYSVISLLRGGLFAITALFQRVMGFGLADFFVTATSGAGGLSTALYILGTRLAALVPILALVAAGLYTARKELQLFQDKAYESQTQLNAGANLDHFNESVRQNIDLLVKDGKMTAEHAKEVKLRLAEIQVGFANGTISADRYRKALEHVAEQLKKSLPPGGMAALNAAAAAPAAPASDSSDEIEPGSDQGRLFQEIQQKYLEATQQKRALLDVEYADEILAIKDKLAGTDKYYQALTMARAAYDAKIVELDKEAADKAAKAKTEAADKLEKQQRQAEESKRAQLEGQLRAIQDNPLLTALQKMQQQLPINQQLLAMDDQRAAVLRKMIADTTASEESRLSAERELVAMAEHRADLESKITLAQNVGNVGFQFGVASADIQSKWTTWAQQSADAFKNAWSGATSSVSNGFVRLFEYGAQKGQWFREIYQGVVGSIIKSFTDMAVSWAMNHVLMSAVSRAWHALESALGLQTVAQHVAGEGTKTAATAGGVTARGMLHVAETVFHGVQVALRTAAHLAGELMMTMVSLAQSLLRRIGAFAEAQPYIFLAAVKAASSVADIPIVGPILAPIAGAAVFAALEAMAVFREGGLVSGPGSETSDSVPARLSRGEYVIPANRVRQFGSGFFEAIRQGKYAPELSAAVLQPIAAANGPVQVKGHTLNAHFYDERPHPRDFMASSEGEQMVVNIARKNRVKIGVGT